MKKIKVLIMDVDGTMTDGKIHIGNNGEVFKSFDVKDGYGIKVLLKEADIEPIIITGRKSEIVQQRCQELDIKQLYQNIKDKKEILEKILFQYNIDLTEVAYMGDDLNDIECMKNVGVAGCPRDAVREIKLISEYVSERNGGGGAIREFIEYIIGRNLNLD